MSRIFHPRSIRAGIALISVLAVVMIGSAFALGSPSPSSASLPCRDGGPKCLNIGFTNAWYDGNTVQLGYSHRFFCRLPGAGEDRSQCEAGRAATIAPPSGPVVSNVYLLVPMGFSPPASTLQCPVRGHCIASPHSIDMSRAFASGGKNAVLPAHSFVIEDQEAFQSTWWPVVLVGVKTLQAWNTIAAAKNIAAVDACQGNGGCFQEVPTNAFLFFQVLGPGMSPQGPA